MITSQAIKEIKFWPASYVITVLISDRIATGVQIPDVEAIQKNDTPQLG